MSSFSLPNHANAAVIEAAYQAWQADPNSVDPTWRAFFQGFTLDNAGGALTTPAATEAGVSIIDSLKQSHVHYLIASYRALGHL